MTNYIFNIAALGDGQVGKTSVTRRFVTGKFDSNYIRTIGDEVTKIETNTGEHHITLMIHDPSGQKYCEEVQNTAIKKCKGFHLIFDMSRKTTYNNLNKYWGPKIKKLAAEKPFVIIGNKNDLPIKEINARDIEELANSINMPYYLSSAKTGENIEKSFAALSEMIINGQKPKYPSEW